MILSHVYVMCWGKGVGFGLIDCCELDLPLTLTRANKSLNKDNAQQDIRHYGGKQIAVSEK